MVAVYVHGLPETARIWDALRKELGDDSIAVELPGFGALRIEGPIDLVGHDIGALLVMRVVTAVDVPSVRSYAVDVAEVFHPDATWPERTKMLQTPGAGEDLLRSMREAAPDSPGSTASRLAAAGVPLDEAGAIGAAHDETMSACVLDFYRSAVPNVASDWWPDVRGVTRARGLVLLLPDPPEVERMALEVAAQLGAETARLSDLEHCWMAHAPDVVASVLRPFWSS